MDMNELKLFKLFNNGFERHQRHIDAYYEEKEGRLSNEELILRDAEGQLEKMREYFNVKTR